MTILKTMKRNPLFGVVLYTNKNTCKDLLQYFLKSVPIDDGSGTYIKNQSFATMCTINMSHSFV
jgi:hypothetical protein